MPVTLFVISETCIYGKEFRLIRRQKRLSLAQIAERMNKRGWAYYPSKIFRLERRSKFCLPGDEMMDLLKALEVDFELK